MRTAHRRDSRSQLLSERATHMRHDATPSEARLFCGKWKGSRFWATLRSRQARSSVLRENQPFNDFNVVTAALGTIACSPI
jgi:hypothetical protein